MSAPVGVAELLVLPRPIRLPVVPLRPAGLATGRQHLLAGLCLRLILSVAARLVEAVPACLFGLDVRDGRGDPFGKTPQPDGAGGVFSAGDELEEPVLVRVRGGCGTGGHAQLAKCSSRADPRSYLQ